MVNKPKILLSIIFSFVACLTVNAACPPGGNCNCGPNYDKLTCGTLLWDCTYLSCSCKTYTGTPSASYGAPGQPTPDPEGSTTVNACDGEKYPNGRTRTIKYDETTGWAIEICVGAEVQLGTGQVPGANWTLSASGCWSYDSKSTIEISEDVSAGKCEKWRYTIVTTPTPVNVTVPLTYKTSVIYTNDTWLVDCCNDFGYGAGGTWTLEYQCGTGSETGTTHIYDYDILDTDLSHECDPDDCC